MPRYRLHLFEDDRVARKFIVWCENDERALDLARTLRHPGRTDILYDGALLARLDRGRLVSAH